MTPPVYLYTKSQRDHAQLLLKRRYAWTRGTRKADGLVFFIFESSRTNADGTPKGYMATATLCDCPGFKYRHACAHQLAVYLDVKRAREHAGPLVRYEDVYANGDHGNVWAF